MWESLGLRAGYVRWVALCEREGRVGTARSRWRRQAQRYGSEGGGSVGASLSACRAEGGCAAVSGRVQPGRRETLVHAANSPHDPERAAADVREQVARRQLQRRAAVQPPRHRQRRLALRRVADAKCAGRRVEAALVGPGGVSGGYKRVGERRGRAFWRAGTQVQVPRALRERASACRAIAQPSGPHVRSSATAAHLLSGTSWALRGTIEVTSAAQAAPRARVVLWAAAAASKGFHQPTAARAAPGCGARWPPRPAKPILMNRSCISKCSWRRMDSPVALAAAGRALRVLAASVHHAAHQQPRAALLHARV